MGRQSAGGPGAVATGAGGGAGPAISTVIVIGEPAAPLLMFASKSSAIAQKILGLLSPFLSPAARTELAALTVDELVTRVVLWLRLNQVPPELVAAVPDIVK